MGKIHDALKRAEEQRSTAGGAPGGPATPEVLEHASSTAGTVERTRDRTEALRAGRRSRVITAGASAVAEEYRTLKARIQSIRRERDIHTLVVTSACPGEGKTTTAVNLALSYGLDLGTNTCLVDCDMRTPSVHQAFPELPRAGLAEVLEADAKLEEALIAVPDTRLSVLAVKALPTYPAELLSSEGMRKLLEELSSRFDTVVIDAPPVLGLPDAVTLVDATDATLMVVSAGTSARNDVSAAIERLDRDKLIGTVFNRCEAAEQPYGGSYGGAYGAGAGAD